MIRLFLGHPASDPDYIAWKPVDMDRVTGLSWTDGSGDVEDTFIADVLDPASAVYHLPVLGGERTRHSLTTVLEAWAGNNYPPAVIVRECGDGTGLVYGPYDVTRHSVQEPDGRVRLQGSKGAAFDAVFADAQRVPDFVARLDDAVEEIEGVAVDSAELGLLTPILDAIRFLISGDALGVSGRAAPPFNLWRQDDPELPALLVGSFGQGAGLLYDIQEATSVASVRSALAAVGMSCSMEVLHWETAGVAGSPTGLQRAPSYTRPLWWLRPYPRYPAVRANGAFTAAVERQPTTSTPAFPAAFGEVRVARRGTVANVAWRGVADHPPVTMLDAANTPGAWQARQLLIAERQFVWAPDIVEYTFGTGQPPIYLPIQGHAGLARVVSDIQRWDLQNTAAGMQLAMAETMPPTAADGTLTPRQIVTVPAETLPADWPTSGRREWLVRAVTYQHLGGDGVRRTLDLSLWQGGYRREE